MENLINSISLKDIAYPVFKLGLSKPETMDKVVMNKGGAKDYFFSDHLKKGGMSYAQQHKNILQNGGGQTEVNMLAKMQEKAANRDPKQVAKLGGVMKYEQGGVFNSKKHLRKINCYQRTLT